MRNMALVTLIAILVSGVSANAATFNIKDFAAAGDKTTNDAPAIQAAIDNANSAGGGTVICPAGDYLASVIHLKSNVTLYLEQGATLWASTDPCHFEEIETDGVLEGDYNGHLIVANGQHNIAIEGNGVLNGQGTADLARRAGAERDKLPEFRIGILHFENCKYVTIRDIKVINSDTWTLHFKLCRTVNIDGVTIHNNYWRTNTDGIDLNSCRDVHVSNCNIIAGDDCICFKTSSDIPCENIVVTNCTLETVATAAKFGTASAGDFRDIRFSNCTIRNSTVGIGFYIKDGGTAERISFENISITTIEQPNAAADWLRNMIYPIFIDIEQRTNDTPAGSVKDVTFSNIHILSDNGILCQGMPEAAIQNLTCRDITIRVNKPWDFSARTKHTGGVSNPRDRRKTIYARQPSYFTLANVKGLTLDNIRVFVADPVKAQYPRRALSIHDSTDGVLNNVWGTTNDTEPFIAMENCSGISVTNSYTPAGADKSLSID